MCGKVEEFYSSPDVFYDAARSNLTAVSRLRVRAAALAAGPALFQSALGELRRLKRDIR
jgi:hypothetical protein